MVIFGLNETPQNLKKQIPHRHHRIFGVDGIFRQQQPLAAFAVPQRIE